VLFELRDLDAERATLNAILIDPGAGARADLTPEDFADAAHGKIFAAMQRLRARGVPADPVVVRAELEAAGDLDAAGGPAYVAGLMDGGAVAAHVEHYVGIVRNFSQKRRGWKDGMTYIAACSNGHTPAQRTEAASTLYLAALDNDREAKRRVCSTADAFDDYAAEVGKGPGRKIMTGLASLDALCEGFNPGEVITVIKRPQVGGSALASQLLVNASHDGIASVFFSLEMPRAQAVERLLMQRLGITRHEVERHAKAGWRTLSEAERAAMDALSRAVVVVDRGKSGIADLDASMIEATAILGRKPRLVGVDYLGLMGSGARNLKLYERVSEAAIDVKSFAKRHDVAVVLISQAGRDPDPAKSEGAAELGLDAARDSGQIEEAADFVLTAWREELRSTLKPEQRAEVRGDLSASLVKNRRGPLGRFRLHLDTTTLRIRPWGEEA
jgi:replicative DNA helicase